MVAVYAPEPGGLKDALTLLVDHAGIGSNIDNTRATETRHFLLDRKRYFVYSRPKGRFSRGTGLPACLKRARTAAYPDADLTHGEHGEVLFLGALGDLGGEDPPSPAGAVDFTTEDTERAEKGRQNW